MLVSACNKCRNIRSYRLTTCYGLHQKTSFVSIRPHSSAHPGDSSTQRPTLPSWPSIRSFTWQGLETSSWSSSRTLDRPAPQRHWICSCQPLETDWQTDRPFYVAMVEWRNGPSWLHDDDHLLHRTACRYYGASNDVPDTGANKLTPKSGFFFHHASERKFLVQKINTTESDISNE